jgi:hypothetical protein
MFIKGYILPHIYKAIFVKPKETFGSFEAAPE